VPKAAHVATDTTKTSRPIAARGHIRLPCLVARGAQSSTKSAAVSDPPQPTPYASPNAAMLHCRTEHASSAINPNSDHKPYRHAAPIVIIPRVHVSTRSGLDALGLAATGGQCSG
jgi:hypothetical protein